MAMRQGLYRAMRYAFVTTRHAASLRTPRNGRIGFKPPYSKREASVKVPRMGSIFWVGFPLLAGKPFLIMQCKFSKTVAARRAASLCGDAAGLYRAKRYAFVTTRHAASLRTPRNGRIGFKPPYSKRGTAEKGP